MNNIKTTDETYIAAKAILEGQINEASGQSDPDITVWTKKGNHNYYSFLAANEDRIGKPMIDGGLKVDRPNADKVNGQPVDDIIYVGAGCITFDAGGKKIFTDIDPGYLNTSDGTVPWSAWKNYRGNARISVPASEFKDIAAAVALAAKI